jgi:hypothetical protein
MSEVNYRAPSYRVAHTPGVCAQCGASTRLVALVLPPGHEVLDPEDGPEARESTDAARVAGDEFEDDGHARSAGGVWSVATGSAFLFFVEYIPQPVLHRMHTHARAYRLSSRVNDAPHWVNHCDACGAAFDDDELFGEPGAGFVPTSQAEARIIELVPVDEPLEVGAGGYAYEPEFFDCMRRG